MEPLSEAALGVLRDKTIADYLLEHCCGTTVFSKLDHGQKLLDHITQQFKLAGLPVPQTYMKSVDNVCDRVKKFTADKSGHFKKEVDANCELVRYVLALRGIDTKKGLLAAIATAAAPATAPAADASTAAPPACGSGHDNSGLQSENDNRYNIQAYTQEQRHEGREEGGEGRGGAEGERCRCSRGAEIGANRGRGEQGQARADP